MNIVKAYIYAGIILIGCSAALHYFLYLSLREAGRNYIAFNWFRPFLSDASGRLIRLRSEGLLYPINNSSRLGDSVRIASTASRRFLVFSGMGCTA